jgi:hypothetical protein
MMDLDFSLGPAFDYVEERAVYDTWNRDVKAFRNRPYGTREYPYLGERQVRDLFSDPKVGDAAALCALAAAYHAQQDFERSARQTLEKNRVGFQGGHAVAGVSLGAALISGGREGLAELLPPIRVRGPAGWQFDGRLWTSPLEAGVALGRRYSKCLVRTLLEQQLATEPPEERERLTRFSI